jgi:hypothetical protein
MILISHRGNINGPIPKKENKPSYIQTALDKGFDVEIDVWYQLNQWWLGHNEPQYKITYKWIFQRYTKLWIHCKELSALHKLTRRDGGHIYSKYFNYFWHQNDDYAITNGGFIWTFPRKPLSEISICVLPELCTWTPSELSKCYGICSDNIKNYK